MFIPGYMLAKVMVRLVLYIVMEGCISFRSDRSRVQVLTLRSGLFWGKEIVTLSSNDRWECLLKEDSLHELNEGGKEFQSLGVEGRKQTSNLPTFELTWLTQ